MDRRSKELMPACIVSVILKRCGNVYWRNDVPTPSSQHSAAHTPSIAFRHLSPRKDVVNQCLEFECSCHYCSSAIVTGAEDTMSTHPLSSIVCHYCSPVMVTGAEDTMSTHPLSSIVCHYCSPVMVTGAEDTMSTHPAYVSLLPLQQVLKI